MQTQVAALENALGGLQRIYPETIAASEEEGMAPSPGSGQGCFKPATAAATPSSPANASPAQPWRPPRIWKSSWKPWTCPVSVQEPGLMIPLTSPSVASRLQAHRQAQEARRGQPPPLRTHRRPHRRDAARRRGRSPAHQRAAPGTVPRRHRSLLRLASSPPLRPGSGEFHRWRWLQNWAARQHQAPAEAATGQFFAEEPEDEAPIDTPPA